VSTLSDMHVTQGSRTPDVKNTKTTPER